MLNSKQCELACKMTGVTIPDAQIIREYSSLQDCDKETALREINKLLVEHNQPFDTGIQFLQNDFANTAKKYNITPATLFCVYMDSKQTSK